MDINSGLYIQWFYAQTYDRGAGQFVLSYPVAMSTYISVTMSLESAFTAASYPIHHDISYATTSQLTTYLDSNYPIKRFILLGY